MSRSDVDDFDDLDDEDFEENIFPKDFFPEIDESMLEYNEDDEKFINDLL